MPELTTPDNEHAAVRSRLVQSDPGGVRFGKVLRATFDQLYDGQHTGRYRWDQLHKTEKTHFGTLVEINVRREFDDVIDDGVVLDYSIAGIDVDCKYSQTIGSWMIPPEAFEKLLLVVHANDAAGEFAVGLVRAREEWRRTSSNRDGKTGLNKLGRENTDWLFFGCELPPNVLLTLPEHDIDEIFALRSGQKRVNDLFRKGERHRIGRATVATVAQQDDFMKRVRDNGGARGHLRDEGYLILGGDYSVQRNIARDLGLDVPLSGEFVSVRVRPARDQDPYVVDLDGERWAPTDGDEAVFTSAPSLPKK